MRFTSQSRNTRSKIGHALAFSGPIEKIFSGAAWENAE
jgi:hypothetical protein